MKKTIAGTLTLLLMLLNLTSLAYAQSTVELRGIILDEAKAFIAAAPVTLDDGQGNKYTAQSDDQGRYRITGIKPGLYTLTVEIEGFAKFSQQVDLTKRVNTLDVTLKVGLAEQVEVKSDATTVSTEPDKNLSAITLTEKDLEALPDDPDELLNTLKQMAGAGADEAQVYVGGFRERGQLPPKEAILRININQNPFSAEFSERGHARIEIVTKPGSDTYHGGFNLNFNDEALNARDPFANFRAPFQYRRYGGNLSGPIVRNRAGFFLDFFRSENDLNDIVNAVVLNPITLQPEPFTATILTPQRSFNFSIRTDILLNKRHTIGVQFRHAHNEFTGGGGGGFNLPERAAISSSGEDTLRFSLTTIASEHAVNEMRIQLSRRHNESQAVTDTTTINVLDAFVGGGSQAFTDNTNRNLDFTDNLTYTYKKHTMKFGFRAEAIQLENFNRSNFRGTFLFGRDFERDQQGRIIANNDGAPISISPVELYRRVLSGEPGYRPTQFSINRGDPFVGFNQWEYGFFAQDDWKVSQKLTLSFGLRHELQTHLDDKINLAPRFGIVWSPTGKAQQGVIRAGGGIFYNRLDNGITSDVIRFDGVHQQQFIIQQPSFFGSIPDDLSGAVRVQPTIRIKSDGLNAPYTMLTSIGYERQLTKTITATATYTWSRGVHLLRSRNINAPIGFEDGQPIRPFPGEGTILQYESTGLSTRNEVNFNFRAMINPKIQIFGNYILSSTRSNTDGQGTLPASSYDLTTEWGRASWDARHRFFIGGNFTLPGEVRLNPFITANTGQPFNITTGSDNNRDNYFTDRPAFANPGDPGAIETRFGTFNPNPTEFDEIIPRNFAQGPGFLGVNLGISRTIGFGGPAANNFPGMMAGGGNQQSTQATRQSSQPNQPAGQQAQTPAGNRGGNNASNNGGNRAGNNSGNRGGNRGGAQAQRGGSGGGGTMMMGGPGMFGGGRSKYNLTLSVTFSNILNHTNFAQYNGVLTSSFFGRANRSAGGNFGFGGGGFFGGNGGARRIDLGLRFNF